VTLYWSGSRIGTNVYKYVPNYRLTIVCSGIYLIISNALAVPLCPLGLYWCVYVCVCVLSVGLQDYVCTIMPLYIVSDIFGNNCIEGVVVSVYCFASNIYCRSISEIQILRVQFSFRF